MKNDDIYNWLMRVDPVESDKQIRTAWANMASYLYLITKLKYVSDFDSKLETAMLKAKEFDIQVPDEHHSAVIMLANKIGTRTEVPVLKLPQQLDHAGLRY